MKRKKLFLSIVICCLCAIFLQKVIILSAAKWSFKYVVKEKGTFSELCWDRGIVTFKGIEYCDAGIELSIPTLSFSIFHPLEWKAESPSAVIELSELSGGRALPLGLLMHAEIANGTLVFVQEDQSMMPFYISSKNGELVVYEELKEEPFMHCELSKNEIPFSLTLEDERLSFSLLQFCFPEKNWKELLMKGKVEGVCAANLSSCAITGAFSEVRYDDLFCAEDVRGNLLWKGGMNLEGSVALREARAENVTFHQLDVQFSPDEQIVFRGFGEGFAKEFTLEGEKNRDEICGDLFLEGVKQSFFITKETIDLVINQFPVDLVAEQLPLEIKGGELSGKVSLDRDKKITDLSCFVKGCTLFDTVENVTGEFVLRGPSWMEGSWQGVRGRAEFVGNFEEINAHLFVAEYEADVSLNRDGFVLHPFSLFEGKVSAKGTWDGKGSFEGENVVYQGYMIDVVNGSCAVEGTKFSIPDLYVKGHDIEAVGRMQGVMNSLESMEISFASDLIKGKVPFFNGTMAAAKNDVTARYVFSSEGDKLEWKARMMLSELSGELPKAGEVVNGSFIVKASSDDPHIFFDGSIEPFGEMRGKCRKLEQGWDLTIDHAKSTIYGWKIDQMHAAIDEEFHITECDLQGVFSIEKLGDLIHEELDGTLCANLHYDGNFLFSGKVEDFKGYTFGLNAEYVEKRAKLEAKNEEFSAQVLFDQGDFSWDVALPFVESRGAGTYENLRVEGYIDQCTLFVEHFYPKIVGRVGVTGPFALSSQGGEGSFTISGEEITSEGLLLDVKEPISWKIDRENGLEIEHCTLQILEPHLNTLLGHVHLDHLLFGKKVDGEGGVYISSSLLYALQACELIPQLPIDLCNNDLEAKLLFEKRENNWHCAATFNDGRYDMGDHSFQLSRSVLSLDPNEISLSTNLHFGTKPIRLYGKWNWENELLAKLYAENKCIAAKGSFDRIEHIAGEIPGLSLDFKGASEKKICGKAHVDFTQLSPYLPAEIAAKIERFELGRGYSFYGTASFPLSLYGRIEARDFSCFGYYFDQLFTNFTYENNKTILENFELIDQCGQVSIKQLLCDSINHINVPLIRITDFQPALMRTSKEKEWDPFMFRNLSIYDLMGDITDLSTLSAYGHANFTNDEGKTSHLFTLPLDVIKDIGIDWELLTPIRGEIDFILKNQAFVLTDLRNAYSRDKRSLFYLAKEGKNTINLKGKMHIDLAMKQNVLLKVTEPFRLCIRGSVDKPSYSLR